MVNRSSPMRRTRSPIRVVSSAQPAQSSSSSPSSTETIGKSRTHSSMASIISAVERVTPSRASAYWPPGVTKECAATSMAISTSRPGSSPAVSNDSTMISSACRPVRQPGERPPSSARSVGRPRRARTLGRRRTDPAHAVHRLGQVGGPCGHGEEVLDVHSSPGMQPAGEDVDHRHRQDGCVDAGQVGDVPEERSPRHEGTRPAHRKRGPQHRIGAETRQRCRAVQVPQQRVDRLLIGGCLPAQCGSEFVAHGVDRAVDAQPGVVARVAVTALVGLVGAG